MTRPSGLHKKGKNMLKKKKNNEIEQAYKLAIFKGTQIRRIIYNDEWWFSVIDIIKALTGTERPRKYWNDLKKSLQMRDILKCPKKSDS